jgi:hypothetical protein
MGKIRVQKANGETYLREDLGKLGHGPKLIPVSHPGTLGGTGFFSMPEVAKQKIIRSEVGKYGKASVLGKLQALVNFNTRQNPGIAAEAKKLHDWAERTFR